MQFLCSIWKILHLAEYFYTGTAHGARNNYQVWSCAEPQCYRPSETGEEDDMLGKFVGKAVGDHETAITEIAGEQLVVNTRWQHYFETVGGNPYLTPIWSEWAI